MPQCQLVSSALSRAFGFVTFTDSCSARSTIALRFFADTSCAISAEKRRFCMSNTSKSCGTEKRREIGAAQLHHRSLSAAASDEAVRQSGDLKPLK